MVIRNKASVQKAVLKSSINSDIKSIKHFMNRKNVTIKELKILTNRLGAVQNDVDDDLRY